MRKKAKDPQRPPKTKDPKYHMLKTLVKNEFIFRTMLYTKKGFAFDLVKLHEKWPSPFQDNAFRFPTDYEKYEEIRQINSLVEKQRSEFVSKLVADNKYKEFQNDISFFLHKYDLGDEWHHTITNSIICNWLFPPRHNLSIEERGTDARKRVVLVINPDTSIEDIISAWPIIKENQRKLWPSFKKLNLTAKSFENLQIAVKDQKQGKKEFDFGKMEYYKIEDLDKASKLWEQDEDDSEQADKKRAANLRQIRSRFKRKMM